MSHSIDMGDLFLPELKVGNVVYFESTFNALSWC